MNIEHLTAAHQETYQAALQEGIRIGEREAKCNFALLRAALAGLEKAAADELFRLDGSLPIGRYALREAIETAQTALAATEPAALSTAATAKREPR